MNGDRDAKIEIDNIISNAQKGDPQAQKQAMAIKRIAQRLQGK